MGIDVPWVGAGDLRSGSERGSAAVEAVIGVPAFMLLVLLAIMGGRVVLAHQAVQTAAADAARAASIARTAADAKTAATRTAQASLDNQHLTCSSTAVAVNTAGFSVAVGTDAQVAATVTCTLALADLGIPGAASRTITVTMSSPLDTHRERAPS